MSEYWKSTPKYFCQYCKTFVRDTKLERTHHDATGRHQSAARRFLNNLHRDHEREQRDHDRARREIDRLNGVAPAAAAAAAACPPSPDEERRRRLEQLAGLGVALPAAARPALALAGDWTVTARRVVSAAPLAAEGVAEGVRKRAPDANTDDDDDAPRSRRRRGPPPRDPHTLPPPPPAELDALLSGAVAALREPAEPGAAVKPEPAAETAAAVKTEEAAGEAAGPAPAPCPDADDVVFRQRKAKPARRR